MHASTAYFLYIYIYIYIYISIYAYVYVMKRISGTINFLQIYEGVDQILLE